MLVKKHFSGKGEKQKIARVLQKTKTKYEEAFRLICSDDVRREGFFREAGALDERFPGLESVKTVGHKTKEGVWVAEGHTVLAIPNLGAILVFNEQLSVRASITYRDDGESSDVGLVQIEGLQIGREDEHISLVLELSTTETRFGVLVFGRFHGARFSLWPNGGNPFEGQERNFISCDIATRHDPHHRSTEIHELNATLISAYPEENFRMVRIMLNLLSEFQVMIDSSSRYFGGCEKR